MPSSPAKTQKKKAAKKPVKPKTAAVKSQFIARMEQPFPGVWRYSKEVYSTLVHNRRLFGRFVLLAWVTLLLVVGLSLQTQYTALSQSTEEVSGQLAAGGFKAMVEITALFIALISGSLATNFSESQQISVSVVYLLMWLTLVWLLRHVLSGNVVRLRDGLYNSGAPVVSTLAVIVWGILQLVPLALIVTIIAALVNNGIMQGVIWSTLAILIVLLVTAMTAYWLVGTLIAAVVVTIPGTYPWAAIKSVRTLISGYRRLVLIRMLWLAVVNLAVLLVVMIPIITIDSMAGYKLSTFVITIYQLVSVTLFLYNGSYLYMLYRKVIDVRA